jgi:hypothetical protein
MGYDSLQGTPLPGPNRFWEIVLSMLQSAVVPEVWASLPTGPKRAQSISNDGGVNIHK